MRIGLDARFLTHPQVGGFKTYTENLIRAFSQVDETNEYILYLDRKPQDAVLPKARNFSYQVVPGIAPYWGMPLREQVTLRRQIARDGLDVVHFLCNTAPIALPQPFVLTLHDTIQLFEQHDFSLRRSLAAQKHWLMNTYSRWSILKSVTHAQRVITVSHYEKEQIVGQLPVAPQRVVVTHLAANPIYRPACPVERAQYRAEVTQHAGITRKFILGVGYEARKNIGLLMEAFALVAPSQPDLDLVVVVAHEASRRGFQQVAAALGLAHRMAFLESQSPAQLVKLYNLAEVFVYPSDRESFGLPPLEALACGTPTVAMNQTSLPEILCDGALLVNGKEPATWAAALDRLLTDVALRTELAQRGLEQARRLSWHRCAQETVAVYKGVANPTARMFSSPPEQKACINVFPGQAIHQTKNK